MYCFVIFFLFLLLAICTIQSSTKNIFQLTEPIDNHSPYIPHNPIPENGSANQPLVIYFLWLGGDPDPEDFVTYDVYFGTSNQPPKVISNQSTNSYIPGVLNYSTTYYWKIISWDSNGEYAIGPIWHFTTILDTIPPFTIYDFDGIIGNNGWYINDVIITLNALDNQSGVNHTFYTLNNDSWNEYSLPVVLSIDGHYSIRYYSIDKTGNVESIKGPFLFMIDQSSPSISLTKQQINLFEVKFIADVNDLTSGVDYVFFLIDGEVQWNDSEPPYEWTWTGVSAHNMTAIVFDIAGNAEFESMSTSFVQIQQSNSFRFKQIKQLLHYIIYKNVFAESLF